MTMFSRVLGFARDAIVARIFGAGMATDAFFVAFKLPNLLRRIFAEGAFSQAFVPILAEYKSKQGEDATRVFVSYVSGLLTLALAKVNGHLSETAEAEHLTQLRHLPVAVAKVVELEPEIERWAQRFADKQHALFLGRGEHYPIALEGALKLKEISYIHAEAYPAGELKHGPLALVDSDMPVVTVAPNNELLEKLKSNLQEVRARGGQLIVFADGAAGLGNGEGTHVINMPHIHDVLAPILYTVPLQLLSYYTALERGCDIDKPRNLAKSVTVE